METRMRSVGLVMIAATLVGCQYLSGTDAASEREAQDAIRNVMNDPGSAQFRSMKVNEANGSALVCGEANGKNALGGYAGFTRFIYRKGGRPLFDPKSERTVGEQDAAAEMCRSLDQYPCDRAAEIESEIARQGLFEREWELSCQAVAA
jgi:hypothetical protein